MCPSRKELFSFFSLFFSDLPKVHGVEEGLGAVGGPERLVGELGHVPHELVHDLGELDGVRSRAAAATVGTAVAARVGDVGLVVGGVEVLAVPAGGEDDGLTHHLAGRVGGDVDGVGAGAGGTADKLVVVGRGPATVADAALVNLGGVGFGGVARDHAEALLEGRGPAAGDVVDVKTAVVDELALGTAVARLPDAVVRAVLVLEEHDGRPVVGLVLGEGARGAGGLAGKIVAIGVHGDVERVTTDDLVKMGREEHARVDDGVDTVDGQLRASKSEHALGGGILRQERHGGEGRGQLHLGKLLTSREFAALTG